MVVVSERGSVRRARRDQKCARLAGTYGPGHCSMTLAGPSAEESSRSPSSAHFSSTLLRGGSPIQGVQ